MPKISPKPLVDSCLVDACSLSSSEWLDTMVSFTKLTSTFICDISCFTSWTVRSSLATSVVSFAVASDTVEIFSLTFNSSWSCLAKRISISALSAWLRLHISAWTILVIFSLRCLRLQDADFYKFHRRFWLYFHQQVTQLSIYLEILFYQLIADIHLGRLCDWFLFFQHSYSCSIWIRPNSYMRR